MLLATQTGLSSVALDLVVRQGAFLLLLALLGAGPVALLGERVDLAVRLALAPAFGLALGICLTTALIGLAPVHSTWWVVIIAAAASVALAAWRARRALVTVGRFGRREVVQLVLVLVLAAGPIDYTLHQHYSLGPSVYLVRDVLGYTAEVDGEQHLSLPSAAALSGRPLADLEDQYWSVYAAGYQNMDASTLEASTDDLLGLPASDTIASFMLVLILVGALGAFAAVRYAMASRTWAAALAGVLFGGPFYMQLFFDGSQAAICGTALILPFALLGAEAVRGGGRVRDLVLLGLLAAGLLAAYPLFVPGVAGASVLVLLWLLESAHRAGRLREALRFGAPRVALVLALGAGLASVAFARDLRYWGAILGHSQNLPVLGYHFPVQILPPWIFQTGEFANLPNFIVTPTFGAILRGAILPAALLALIAYGLWRRRIGLGLAGLVVIAAGLAEYAFRSQGCEYCIDRNLLPAEPAAITLIALGVAALAVSARPWMRALAGIGALLALVPTALAMRAEHTRFSNYDYFLDSAVRTLVARLPPHPGPIEIEGFNEDVSGPSEFAAVYDLLAGSGYRVSAPLESNDYISDAYLAPARPAPSPGFYPDYRWVLTRLGATATGRTVVARSGGLALERRTAPLDVTPYAGMGLPLPNLDPAGIGWVAPEVDPFRAYVVGGRGAGPVFVRFTLRSDVPLNLEVGIRTRVRDGTIVACVPATGSAPVRRTVLYMSGQLNPPPLTDDRWLLPMPVEDIQLAGMRVLTGHCTP